ncbi:MAG: hypothetical protein NPINA01_00720 [Nitrospinaceae bacterium]|nr:MAG: hypothetical protein NPINA01_00720 [Nitrospinaceae bacterium]
MKTGNEQGNCVFPEIELLFPTAISLCPDSKKPECIDKTELTLNYLPDSKWIRWSTERFVGQRRINSITYLSAAIFRY